MRRLLAVTLAGAAALSLILVIGAAYGAFDAPANPAVRAGAVGKNGWNVTRRYSVNRVLVIEGECHNRDRAREIAASIVEPIAEAYDEVLIYVRERGTRSPTTRVQWTRMTGYSLLDF